MLLLLLACTPWDIDPNSYQELEGPLWDPNIVAREGGIYVNLPHAGKLLWVEPNSTVTEVELNGAAPERLVAAPDNESVIAIAGWTTCEDDDPKIKTIYDCPDSDLGYAREVNLIAGGKLVKTLDVPPEFQAFSFSNDGRIAAASLDINTTSSLDINGLLNLTAVVFIELDSGETHEVSVGFAAEAILFSEDGAKAVVLSRSQVAVVDLNSWERTVTFPLTLDPDQTVSPQDVVLAEDGRYALVSVVGSADLYVLDLEQESIDLVELGNAPDDMVVDLGSGQTIIVSSRSKTVEVLEHEFFEVQSFELDEGPNRILDTDAWSVLYSEGNYNHDVYLFAPETGEVIEYRAENPIMAMQLAPDGLTAVATLMPDAGVGAGVSGFYDQNYGLGLFPLIEDADPISLVLEGAPVGLELVDQGGVGKALVLMEGVDTLLVVDLASAYPTAVELDRPPTSIHAMPDGTFAITQAAELGQISFLDPADNQLTVVSGFAIDGFLKNDELVRRDQE